MSRLSEMRQWSAGFSVFAALCVILFTPHASAFTEKQANDGQVDFNNHCAECHGPELDGALGPNLHDTAFRKTFANKPVKTLRNYVWEYMPQPTAKSLPDNQLDPIIAWILRKNGVPADGRPLSKASAESEQFTIK